MDTVLSKNTLHRKVLITGIKKMFGVTCIIVVLRNPILRFSNCMILFISRIKLKGFKQEIGQKTFYSGIK